MTYNEFKMCCVIFCKHFDGQKYGCVVKDCYNGDVDISINGCIRYEIINSGELVRFYIDESYMARFDGKYFTVIGAVANLNFHNTIDFLEYFKIPSEDIV